jgi:hypothetical protein
MPASLPLSHAPHHLVDVGQQLGKPLALLRSQREEDRLVHNESQVDRRERRLLILEEGL